MNDYTDQNKPYLSDPDVQLMLAFRSGDKPSFEKLMVKYFPRVLNFIYKYIGNKQLAEDLTQEVFIKVFQSGSRYEPQSKFQTWIFTIAKNVSLNELRKHNRNTFSLDASIKSDEGEFTQQIADSTTQRPDQQVDQDERRELIRKAIFDLPENQRTAVLLRRYEEFSYEEIAQTMNTSLEAVKSLLNRAKENLRNKLKNLI